MDPWCAVVEDEVALEGLDGVTIPSLWIRLKSRQPPFPLKLDDCTKELVWRSLVHNTDLRFHQLPEEREDVVLRDRFTNIDPETGLEMSQWDPDQVKDIYPIQILLDNKDGIQGSCVFFKERTDITKDVRSKSLTPLVKLEEAFQRYGRKLVVVASQLVRFRTLIGYEADPALKLSDDSYCLLERVARARWQGELQSDLHGRTFKTDPRKLHYLRKSLVRNRLIGMHSHVTRQKSGHQQHTILLMLNRFYVSRRNKFDVMMEKVSNILEQSPGQIASMVSLRKDADLETRAAKRVFHTMRDSKLVEFCQIPVEEIDPNATRFLSKNGKQLVVRCLKLLKPYSKKDVNDDDDDDDEDDEDYSARRNRSVPPGSRIMERDVLSQAYNVVCACGPEGIPISGIMSRMNIGKLESRMLCRRLERDGFIKGFMVDEGRQRITNYITHKCVGVSDQLQRFTQEKERSKLLSSSHTPPVAPRTPQSTKSAAKGKSKSSAAEKDQTVSDKRAQEDGQVAGAAQETGPEGSEGAEAKASGRSTEEEEGGATPQTQADVQPAPAENGTPACSQSNTGEVPDAPRAEQDAPEAEEHSKLTPAAPSPSTVTSTVEPISIKVVEVEDEVSTKVTCRKKFRKSEARSHETYRVLKRKNMIIEAVSSFRIVEGLFPLQKMINEQEKQEGVSTKCCKKSILRILHSLSREGLLKIYTTNVIQDGISKKVELYVHPSIQPQDDAVVRLIEQIRFKMSSSYTVLRQQQNEEKRKREEKREQNKHSERQEAKGPKGRTNKKDQKKEDSDFKPTTVKGQGRSFGYQPKMHRLRIIHTFLWYLLYGHPRRDSELTSESPADRRGSDAAGHERQDVHGAQNSAVDEEDEGKESTPGPTELVMKVYSDEETWRKFIPPMRLRKDVPVGWAMLGDVLPCLPLSIFVQLVQINYKVDGLEDYINDPAKQHYLIRALSPTMRTQLLYKRKYLFSFYENLQKLVYMGLVQFGPVEKFKDKDQVCIYLKRNATIIDTTNAEPHYWLVTELPDSPFERRHYTFSTAEDVENYWFDLMCVCLNTPLGVIRTKRSDTREAPPPSFVNERRVFVGLSYLLKGSHEVCDDGTIPGDQKGAAGLHSEFFAHLKRNWLWTSHLLMEKQREASMEANEQKVRLKSLLSRNALRFAFKAGLITTPRCVTPKIPMTTEDIEVRIEPASRNKQVVGGKRQKRKRCKKEVVKVSRRKKKDPEPRKRGPAHDHVDHQALKRMTRQRVLWSLQEDSLLMLCSVATCLLNSKLKRPFVPHCVVRDMLHAESDMSKDKTSVAVGRRTRHILKNPQTVLNYRICLAEVYQDKDLMAQLEETKPQDPNKAEDCADAMNEYIKLLRQKFTSVMDNCDVVVPDTKRQLFSRFRVSAIEFKKLALGKDVITCTDDIHSIVLHNLIQSTLAMTNSQMKLSRSFQTFQIYSKYNHDLLCKVFIECRMRGLVNRRRINRPHGPKKSRGLPILPMSYQMSQSYYKCFSWRFPHTLCTDSFRFLKGLMNNGQEDDRPLVQFSMETEKRFDSAEKPKGAKRTEEKSDTKADESVNASEAVGAVPAQDGGNDLATEADMKTEETSGPEKASNASDQALDMINVPMDSPGGSCMAALSLMSLGLVSVHLSIPKQMVVVDTTLVDNEMVKNMSLLEDEDEDDEDDAEDCEGGKKLEVKAHQASHTKYLMMRGFCSPGIVKIRNLNASDHIVVESCIVKMQLRSTAAHRLFDLHPCPPLDLTKCGPSLLPSSLSGTVRLSPSPSTSRDTKECWLRSTEQRGYAPQDAEACARLTRSLDEAGEWGLNMCDLRLAHADLLEPWSGRSRSLQEYMENLQEEGQVLKVGAMGARYVLMQHAEPWLLTINSKQRPRTLYTRDGLPFLTKKRGCEARQGTEEPPAKKAAADGQVSGDGEDVRETPHIETPVENQDKSLDEGGKIEVGENASEQKEEGEEKREERAGGETGKEAMEEEVAAEETKEDSVHERGKLRPRKVNEGVEETPSSLDGSSEVDDSVSFISRPWRMVDGKLNRQVCKGMLEAMLYHIMARPGLTQQKLVEHYKNVLQPMAVMDLVQALIEMGSVTRRTVDKIPKPSLFSRPESPSSAETQEDPETVFYEPTMSCCLQLCRVLPNERFWNDTMP